MSVSKKTKMVQSSISGRELIFLFIITGLLIPATTVHSQTVLSFPQNYRPEEWTAHGQLAIGTENDHIIIKANGLFVPGIIEYTPPNPMELSQAPIIYLKALPSGPLKVHIDLEDGNGVKTGEIRLFSIQFRKEMEGDAGPVVSQEEFNQLVAEIYSSFADKEQMARLTAKAEGHIEDSPNLENYANRLILSTI